MVFIFETMAIDSIYSSTSPNWPVVAVVGYAYRATVKDLLL